MTTFSAIADSEIDPESPYTTTLATKMRDNWISALEGDATATGHRVQENALDASIVSQGKLKTALQQNTGTIDDGQTLEITLTGGTYSLGYTAAINAAVLGQHNLKIAVDSSYTTEIAIHQGSGSNNQTYYVQSRYVQASPPYDLGDGEILLFLDAVINTNGDIISINSAPDPVWSNNGPTDIRPTEKRNGKGYRKNKIIPDNIKSLNYEERVKALRECECVEIEITTDFKNSDMNIVPHTFKQRNDITRCLLDPVSPIIEDLALLRAEGEDINKIIMDGYIKIGNTDIGRKGPSGILIPSLDWKKTK